MWVINLSGSWEAWLPQTSVLLHANGPIAMCTPLHSLACLQQPHATWSVPKKWLSLLQNLFTTSTAPDAVGSDGPLGLLSLYDERFTSPRQLLMLQWVKVSFWVGAIASSKESWHLFGRQRFPMWRHLPQSLEAELRNSDRSQETFLASGRGWPESPAGSLLGPGTVPHHMSPAEHNLPSGHPSPHP